MSFENVIKQEIKYLIIHRIILRKRVISYLHKVSMTMNLNWDNLICNHQRKRSNKHNTCKDTKHSFIIREAKSFGITIKRAFLIKRD